MSACNITADFVRETGRRAQWENRCITLAEAVLYSGHPVAAGGQIVGFEPVTALGLPVPGGGALWHFHAAPLIQGRVHDAWWPEIVLAPVDFAAAAWPGTEVRIHIGDAYEIGQALHQARLRIAPRWVEFLRQRGKDVDADALTARIASGFAGGVVAP